MKQKSCIEGISSSSNLTGTVLPFFLSIHGFVPIDHNRLALLVKSRLAIKKKVNCLG